MNFYPGLLMAGILTYLLIQLFFAFPGVSFGLITGISSVTVFILISGLSLLLKNIVGERKLRLEILFITNLFIVLLSVVSTGNN
ncbi:putative membrane protein [Bacteroides fragilis str. J-143-4]|nr:putative membrane protein [Bacteroides fragilis str. J-143-4]EYA25209.1 putative membrane protein [Bacteroides fragilis str. 1007-1-F \